MANTSALSPSSVTYGNTGYGYNAGKNTYVGKGYRTRLTFPSIRTIAEIGMSPVRLTSLTLHFRNIWRDPSGRVRNATAGPSGSATWGAQVAGTGSVSIAADNTWHVLTITDRNALDAIRDYGGYWYLHLTGASDCECCIGGPTSGYAPYITFTWEFDEATVTCTSSDTGDSNIVVNGTNNMTFTINSGTYVNDNTYTLEYALGETTGTIATGVSKTGDTTSVLWTPDISLLNSITQSESAQAEITMTVYRTDSSIYRIEKLNITMKVPDDIQMTNPRLSTNLVSGFANVALKGIARIQVQPYVTAANMYGATVTDCTVTITQSDGTKMTIHWGTGETSRTLRQSGTSVYGYPSWPSGVITSAGRTYLSVKFTDSRGRSVEAINCDYYDVRDYEPPVISSFSVDRIAEYYDEDEQSMGYAPSDTGDRIWVNMVASCTSITRSSRELNGTTWTLVVTNISVEPNVSTTYTGTGGVSLVLADDMTAVPDTMSLANAYTFEMTVADLVGKSVTQYDNIVPGRANFHLAGSKYGAAFGGIARGTQASPLLESFYPVKFYEDTDIDGDLTVAGDVVFNGNVSAPRLLDSFRNYSTSETATGGTWIDGKPLYRRTFAFASGTARGTYIDISGLNMDFVHVAMAAINYTYGGGSYWNSNYYISGADYTRFYIDASNARLYLDYGTNCGIAGAWATLEYTKTTD